MSLAVFALPGGRDQPAQPSQWWRLRAVSHLWLLPAGFLSRIKNLRRSFPPARSESPSQTKEKTNATNPDSGTSRMGTSGLANHLAKGWTTFFL